jgi:Fe2+ or Zn2+ uptake regulation protein
VKNNQIKLTDFERKVLEAFGHAEMPMASIYMLCRRMNEPQSRSNSKFYVKTYRTLEKLVDKNLVWVMRGTRDPSVYMAKYRAKGHNAIGVSEIPF